jgi:hypothetical protein
VPQIAESPPARARSHPPRQIDKHKSKSAVRDPHGEKTPPQVRTTQTREQIRRRSNAQFPIEFRDRSSPTPFSPVSRKKWPQIKKPQSKKTDRGRKQFCNKHESRNKKNLANNSRSKKAKGPRT